MFIIFLGITIHYNAFLAVLLLRVVLYGPQNLVSFKKFPCTDGLGSTETATSCTATQVKFRLRSMNDLETQKESFETEYCIQGVF